jgi:UDP-N-acetylglucosamine 1-carboxyvinyltransferase
MYFEEASVTGTETALLAAAAARGETEIRHAAMEPHVVELCRFLRKMGAGITGEGTPTIRVEGVAPLRGAWHRLDGDYIEAGSWGVVAAITGGDIEVGGARTNDLEVVAAPLVRMGLRCRYDDDTLRIEPSRLKAVRRVTTSLWPGFPSDMVSLVTVLATQAEGRTLVHDWMYDLRLFALEQLSAMRADLFLCDSHRMIVTGPSKLRGRHLDSRDLRSGMALIAAALAAEGESSVGPVETVERGYGSLVERLKMLGAQVDRIADK